MRNIRLLTRRHPDVSLQTGECVLPSREPAAGSLARPPKGVCPVFSAITLMRLSSLTSCPGLHETWGSLTWHSCPLNISYVRVTLYSSPFETRSGETMLVIPGTALSGVHIKDSCVSTGRCWLVGWRAVPLTKRSWVRFSVRAQTQVAGSVPTRVTWGSSQSMFLSHINVRLSLSLPPSLPKAKKTVLR